jgi:hypothetical protein
MLDRGAKPSPEEAERQRRFEALIASHGGYTAGTLGRDFLNRHPELLDQELQRA